MPAKAQASPQAGLGSQHGPENEIVLQYERPDVGAAAPARSKLIMVLDFYDQKSRVTLMILISWLN